MTHHTHLTLTDTKIPERSLWRSLAPVLFLVGVIGILASFILGFKNRDEFFFSYLVSFIFFLSIMLGALAFVLIHFASGATWSIVIRRIAENVAGVLPLFVLLFIPIIFGLHDLFHWSHKDAVAHDPLLQWKHPYLNEPFFFMRAAIYLVVWSILSHFFRKNSIEHDSTGNAATLRKLTVLSYPGIFLLGISLTFAAFDWIMSVDPHWYSTIFGVYYFTGSLVAILAFLSIFFHLFQASGLLRHAVSKEHFHDLGKLLFSFVCFWAYIAFSQFMLIWYANIPEETLWFAHRWVGSWKPFSIFLAVGHFGIPFFFLMPRTVKRKAPTLIIGSLWMLLIHYLDIFWLIMPTIQHNGFHFSLSHITSFLGIGGLFLGTFIWITSRHDLIPVKDPRLNNSVAFENVL